MKIQLDIFEMYYLLESCFRGSHLRASTILRFADEWYDKLSRKERESLYKWVLRNIYDGEFKPLPHLFGADIVFMARYNPDNQYRLTLKNGETVDAFRMKEKYYERKIAIKNDCIDKIENIGYESEN